MRRRCAGTLKKGVLVHRILDDADEELCRVVVPKEDRLRLLKLAHESGGHLGVKIPGRI